MLAAWRLIHKYFKGLFYSMKGTCEVCGTREIELQEKNVEGQLKNVCNNCACDRLFYYESLISYQA